MKIVKYNGWMLIDVFPRRDDPVKVFNCSVKNIKLMEKVLEKVGVETLMQRIEKGDATEMWRTFKEILQETALP